MISKCHRQAADKLSDADRLLDPDPAALPLHRGRISAAVVARAREMLSTALSAALSDDDKDELLVGRDGDWCDRADVFSHGTGLDVSWIKEVEWGMLVPYDDFSAAIELIGACRDVLSRDVLRR